MQAGKWISGIVAALALAAGLPVSAAFAQTASYPAIPPEELTEQSAETAPVSPDNALEPGEIFLISGNGRLTGELGMDGALDPASRFCLRASETAIFASERALVEVAGGGCYILGEVEAQAFMAAQEAEQEVAEPEPAPTKIKDRLAPRTIEITSATGAISAKYPVGAMLKRNDRICLEEGDQILMRGPDETGALNGPGCFFVGKQLMREPPPMAATPPPAAEMPAPMPEPPSTRRTVTRGTAARRSGGGKPILFRVSSGSRSVLSRYPRRTLVSRKSRICLNAGEQITIVGTNGQRVTYRGPGCARRNSRPTRTNLGGFTFG